MLNKNRKTIIILLLLLIISTFGLMMAEYQSPGTCPMYPFIKKPACFIVQIYFTWALLSFFIKNETMAKIIFLFSSCLSLATGIYFSSREIMGTGHCPRAFDIPIPLCFTVVIAFVLIIYLWFKGKEVSLAQ